MAGKLVEMHADDANRRKQPMPYASQSYLKIPEAEL